MSQWKRLLVMSVVLVGALAIANLDRKAEAQWGYRVGVHYPSYGYPAYYPTYSTFYSSYYGPAYYPTYYRPSYGAYYGGYGVRYGAYYPGCW